MFSKSGKKVVILLILLFIVIFIVGVSYAYTRANFFNVENSTTIAVNGGKMEIIYNDPNGTGYSPNISAEGVIPGWETTKLFTVTGTNEIDSNQTVDTNMYYKVGLVVEENTFSVGALKYEITPDNGEEIPTGQVLSKLTGNVPQSGTEWFGMGYFVPSVDAVVHKYALKISFPETGENQNIDKGKHFAGYVTITDEGEFVNLSVIVDSEKTELNYNLRLLKNSGIYLETPYKEGYAFMDWNIVSGDASIEGNKLLVGNNDVVVEAVWENTTKYVNLLIDLDGGTSETIQTVQTVAENSGVLLDIPVRDGYMFSGWEVLEGDATISGNIVMVKKVDVLLKANWADIIPEFTYLKSNGSTGNYTITRETGNDWQIKFLDSGTLNFKELGNANNGIEVFLVGGGGSGGSSINAQFANSGRGGGGGGGGNTETADVVVVSGEDYEIIFGGSNADTTAFGIIAARGSSGTNNVGGAGTGKGGNGGNAGTLYAGIWYTGGAGGNGANGVYAFGESTGIRYGAGGGGGGGYGSPTGSNGVGGLDGGGAAGKAGAANTGGGGGGGVTDFSSNIAGAAGGSGIVIIRNVRS